MVPVGHQPISYPNKYKIILLPIHSGMDQLVPNSVSLGAPTHSKKRISNDGHNCMTISLIVLLSVGFIVILLTNIGLFFLVFKLGLTPGNYIFDLLRDTNELTIHQDLLLDKVFVSSKVRGKYH